MQLQPREQFTISRQLADPSDSDVNYVRAFVRNALDDTLLKTVNLSLKADQRFTAVYEVPEDVSGLGFYITITTIVYADSAYTTRNFNYNAEQSTYLVQVRPNHIGNGGGGGGADIDYRMIRAIVEEEIHQIEPATLNLTPVMEQFTALSILIGELCIKMKPKPVDLIPLLEALKLIQSAVAKLPDNFPKFPTAIIQESISDVVEAVRMGFTKYDDLADELIKSYEAKEAEIIGKTEESDQEIEQVEQVISDSLSKLKRKKKPEPEIEEEIKELLATDLRKPIKSPFNIKNK